MQPSKYPVYVSLQVQWNLFTVHTLSQTVDTDVSLPRHSMFFQVPDIEDSFRKGLTPQEVAEGSTSFL